MQCPLKIGMAPEPFAEKIKEIFKDSLGLDRMRVAKDDCNVYFFFETDEDYFNINLIIGINVAQIVQDHKLVKTMCLIFAEYKDYNEGK